MYFRSIIPEGNIKISHSIKYSYEGNTKINICIVSVTKYSIDIDYTEQNFPKEFIEILFKYGWSNNSINILEGIILQPQSKWQKNTNINISQ